MKRVRLMGACIAHLTNRTDYLLRTGQLIYSRHWTLKRLDALMKLDLPAGVDVEIKLQ